MMLAALAAAASVTNCAPIPGAKALWASPAVRYVIVGETHGTNEVPEFFADLVCAASKERPVVVALEQDTSDQPALNAFLVSDGGMNARAQFLKSPNWATYPRDGRSSQAMFALLDRLRLFKQAGVIVGVVAFRGPIEEDLAPLLGTPEFQRRVDELGNAGMANELKRAAGSNPKTLVVAHAGSVHVSRDAASNFGVHSAAARLPRQEVRTLFVDGQGFAWMGINAEYGPHPVSGFSRLCGSGTRQITFPTGEQALPGFDAIACVGKAFTASPPAVPPAPSAHQ